MVKGQTLLTPDLKKAMLLRVDAAAKINVSKGITEIEKLGNPTAGAPQPPPGTPEAYVMDLATAHLKYIFRSWVVDAFDWPLFTAAIAALFAIGPGLLLGGRLPPESSYLGRRKREDEGAAAERGRRLRLGFGGLGYPARQPSGLVTRLSSSPGLSCAESRHDLLDLVVLGSRDGPGSAWPLPARRPRRCRWPRRARRRRWPARSGRR